MPGENVDRKLYVRGVLDALDASGLSDFDIAQTCVKLAVSPDEINAETERMLKEKDGDQESN